MKQIRKILFILFIIASLAGCSSSVVNNNAEIEFEQIEVDFGELEYKGVGECSFAFANPGNSPLIIQHVKTSCGCTVPEWPKKPLKPGENGSILIKYDTSHPGMFQKTISVFYNGAESPEILRIKGGVNYPEEDIASNLTGQNKK